MSVRIHFGLRWVSWRLIGLACILTSVGAQPSTRAFELNLSQGTVSSAERVLRVTHGETVQVRITSDEPGVLHLHAYKMEARVEPGPAVEWVFKAHASGRFRFEWHSANASASNRGHHAAPLAVLEVRPK